MKSKRVFTEHCLFVELYVKSLLSLAIAYSVIHGYQILHCGVYIAFSLLTYSLKRHFQSAKMAATATVGLFIHKLTAQLPVL